MSKTKDFLKLSWFVIRRGKKNRTVQAVDKEYTNTWNALRQKLEKSNTVKEWLENTSNETERYYNIDGKFVKKSFNSDKFYRNILSETLEKSYPTAESVAEFGSGGGTNLVHIHIKNPKLKLYGFELSQAGVDLSNDVAKKFNLPIQYFQLDYVNWIPKDIAIPTLDVAFTSFSLEQIPNENEKALRNVFSKVHMGTYHLEPVVENYPITIRGIIARIDHYKVGYLKNFEKNARKVVGKENIEKKTYGTAHNPLMYPSLYILRKS